MRMDRPYITTAEAAAKLNRHQTLVRKWCRQGRIAGAMKVGRDWVVPADVVKPTTGRAGRKWKPENLEKKLAPIVEKMITDSMRKS